MKLIGVFEAKTRLSEICEQVAQTGEPVTLTRRGKPLVRILPVDERGPSILARWEAYRARNEEEYQDQGIEDFEMPARSREVSQFDLEP